jgi:hypothetical protein
METLIFNFKITMENRHLPTYKRKHLFYMEVQVELPMVSMEVIMTLVTLSSLEKRLILVHRHRINSQEIFYKYKNHQQTSHLVNQDVIYTYINMYSIKLVIVVIIKLITG